MSTGAIIAIVVGALILLALLWFVLRAGRERRLDTRREEAREIRREAEVGSAQADKSRAEADAQAAEARRQDALARERAATADEQHREARERHIEAADKDPDADPDEAAAEFDRRHAETAGATGTDTGATTGTTGTAGDDQSVEHYERTSDSDVEREQRFERDSDGRRRTRRDVRAAPHEQLAAGGLTAAAGARHRAPASRLPGDYWPQTGQWPLPCFDRRSQALQVCSERGAAAGSPQPPTTRQVLKLNWYMPRYAPPPPTARGLLRDSHHAIEASFCLPHRGMWRTLNRLTVARPSYVLDQCANRRFIRRIERRSSRAVGSRSRWRRPGRDSARARRRSDAASAASGGSAPVDECRPPWPSALTPKLSGSYQPALCSYQPATA